MQTLFAYAALLVLTGTLGTLALASRMLGVRPGRGSFHDTLMRLWARGILGASGVTVVVHGDAHRRGTRQVFVANHVSRFDVLALAAVLHDIRFIAKAELARLPLFGRAARAVGTVYIRREHRSASFDAYREAMSEIGQGASVVVFAEGTRGMDYALRPFKKGPFVLAIASRAPVVPTVVLGGREVHARGERAVHAGRIDIHFLDPVAVDGMAYGDRDALAVDVRNRMARLLEQAHGTPSPAWDPREARAADRTTTEVIA